MNGFKRFCLIVFSLAGLLTLTALALPWVGPWTAQAKGLLANGIYFTALEVLFSAWSFCSSAPSSPARTRRTSS